MKTNKLKLFLSVVFIAVLGLLAGCNTTNSEPSYVQSIEVIESSIPVGKEVHYFSDSNYGMIELLVTYNDGSTKVVPLAAGIITEQVAKYFDYAGTHTITAYYEGKVTNFDIRIFPNGSEHYTYTYVYATRDSYQEAYLAGEKANQPAFEPAYDQVEVGWFTEETYENQYDFSSNVSSDLTLYQKVDGRYNKISFVVDEEGTIEKEIDVLCGSEAKLYTPEKEGHTFAGWYLNGELVESITMPQEDLVLTAKWNVNSYNVSYETGCDIEIPAAELAYGSKIEVPTEKLEKEGYSFVEWRIDGEAVDFNTAVVPAKDIVLEAVWQINTYKVSFSTPSDVAVSEEEYNAVITYPADPELKGHTFAYWAVNGVESTLTNVPAYDVEFVAVFTANKYPVTFKSEGMEDVVVEVEYGTAVKFIDAPVLEGKGFNGWTLDGKVVYDYIMTDEPVEFVAEYSIGEYRLVIENGINITEEFVSYHSPITLPEPEEVEGYTFVKWATAEGEEVPAIMPAHYLVIKAVYEANNYTLTFNNQGELTEVKFATDQKIEYPATPEKEGYTFVGWSLEGVIVELDIMPAKDIELVAEFVINSYSFNVEVDGVVTTEKYEYASKVVFPETPTKEGYDFVGWSIDGIIVSATEMTMPAHDVTIKAEFEIEKFDLNYNFDEYTRTTRHNYGEKVQLLDLTTVGYTLIGWWYEGQLLKAGDQIVMPDHDVDLIAEIVVNTYTLTYIIDGVKYTKAIDYKEEINLADAPAKVGYTFVGWSKDGEITELTTMPAKDITVEAVYEINSYTLTYQILDEEFSVEYDYNAKVVLPTVKELEGHTFQGWLINGSIFNIEYIMMPANDLTIKAIYTANSYEVVFDNDGVKETKSYVYGTEITLPEYSKVGYTFNGWLNGEVLISDGKYVIPAHNTYLVAEYTINTYKLTIEILGEEIVHEYDYQEAIVLPTAPEKEGHTFVGWSCEGKFITVSTMPAYDFKVKAEYTINSYTLILDSGKFSISEVYEYNATVTLPRYSKVGHTFIGWTDGEEVFTETTFNMPARDLTLTTVFEINSYVLSAEADGKEISSISYVYGTEVVMPEVPAKEGYTIIGWTFNDELISLETMPAYDVKLVAKYAINSYKVTFDNDGVLETSVHEFNAEVELPVCEKEGHDFNGWLLDGVLVEGTKVIVPANDITLVASYSVISYELVTVIEGVETSTLVPYGTTLELPVIPEKVGHSIVGWYNGDNLNTITTMPAEKVVLVAKYSVNSYTITFTILGEETVKSVQYGTEIPYIPFPEITDYTFQGWFEGEVEFKDVTMPARDVKVTAVYERTMYALTYNVEGEIVITEQYYYLDSIKVSSLVPEKFGHTFIGWSHNGEFVGSTISMGREPIELVAEFEEFDYSYLEYKLDNGQIIITGLSGDLVDGLVYIPSVMVVGGVEYPVRTIATQAFAYERDIVNVLINTNLTSIEIYAFRACMKLESIVFADGSELQNIGQNAFSFCSKLSSIVLPEGLKSIGSCAFEGCTALTEIVIPKSVTLLGNTIFDGCGDLIVTIYSSSDKSNWATTWADGVKEVINK